MTLIPTSGPIAEPVTLAEAKAHLRVSGSSEDMLIAALITAARVHLELSLGRAMIAQGWSWFLDQWPDEPVLELPLAPVQSIAAVRVQAADGIVALAPSAYLLDGHGEPPRLATRERASWARLAPAPALGVNGIEIDLVAGYGPSAADVPRPLRQAILLMLAHWFQNREPIEVGAEGQVLPEMVAELVGPYRRVRL
jgi:uncharacterized phiE125 gp8 family phage protein